MTAIKGVGRGKIPKVICFKSIATIKSIVNIAAHFPLFDFDQI
jgi:hypothetical protein